KFNGEKAWYLRFPPAAEIPGLKVGIVGAGYLPFLTSAKELIEHSLNPDRALDDAKDIVGQAVHAIHEEHIYPYGSPYERGDVNISLLVGIVARDGRDLLTSNLT